MGRKTRIARKRALIRQAPPSISSPKRESKARAGLSIGDGLALAGFVLTVGLVVAQLRVTAITQDRDADKEQMKLAVEVMARTPERAPDGTPLPPTARIKEVRKWAVETINKSTEAKIPATAADDSRVRNEILGMII